MKELSEDQAMRSKKSNKRHNKRGFRKEEKCEERGRGGGSRR